MNRREAIFSLVALGACPFPAEAQSGKRIPKLGFLNPGAFAGNPPSEEFFKILKDLGWLEGQNISIERREAKGSTELLSQFAQELVALQPDLIVTNTTPGATAAQKATRSISIVMLNVSDPVKSGFTTSLARPSANITGVASNLLETNQKRVQMIKEIIPSASRIAILGNADNLGVVALMQEAARGASVLGIQAETLAFRGVEGLNAILAMPMKVHALVVMSDVVISNRRKIVARYAVEQRLPAIGTYPEESVDGLLASYGPSLRANWGRAAVYADKILRGAKPADLPIEDPSVIELVINLKTAKALAITIPQSVLLRADRVIE